MPMMMKQPRLTAPTVAVDFPKQDEVVVAREYSVRISVAEPAKKVEVCVDQGDWKACREAIGYWWYDWSGFAPGEHEIISRCQTEDGRKILSEAKEFFVKG